MNYRLKLLSLSRCASGATTPCFSFLERKDSEHSNDRPTVMTTYFGARKVALQLRRIGRNKWIAMDNNDKASQNTEGND